MRGGRPAASSTTAATPATPPATVVLSLLRAHVDVTAVRDGETGVDVLPADQGSPADRRAAGETRAALAGDTLTVTTRRQRDRHLAGGAGGTVRVALRVPAGSRLHGQAVELDLHVEGRLGECRVRVASGSLRFEGTGPLDVTTADGDVSVDRVEGDARVTGAGDVRVGAVHGAVVIRNLNGSSRVGDVSGDVRCTSANGDITVEVARSTVVARTANGTVRVGEAVRGRLLLASAAGDMEIGVRRGTAALLDLRSRSGAVRTDLDPAAGPGPSDETLEVRARTASGDVVVRRA